MFLLDTDHLTLLEWGSGSVGQRLHERIKALPQGEVSTTIITFEEQTRGWLAFQAKARTVQQQVNSYRRLKRHLEIYLKIQVLDFDLEAAQHFERLRRLRPQLGTMDLKIAAISLAHNAVVLSRNLNDFSRIPDLRVEDWTQE